MARVVVFVAPLYSLTPSLFLEEGLEKRVEGGGGEGEEWVRKQVVGDGSGDG